MILVLSFSRLFYLSSWYRDMLAEVNIWLLYTTNIWHATFLSFWWYIDILAYLPVPKQHSFHDNTSPSFYTKRMATHYKFCFPTQPQCSRCYRHAILLLFQGHVVIFHVYHILLKEPVNFLMRSHQAQHVCIIIRLTLYINISKSTFMDDYASFLLYLWELLLPRSRHIRAFHAFLHVYIFS